jgi:DNA-binding PadR family transcriptional regulator
MFGMRHFEKHWGGQWAVGRHGRGRHRHGFGSRGRHGMDGDDMMRARRMLAQGDLRLIALALIAEQPRHGYEIIKLLEEKTEGWYAPSTGMVYPTLTYLEEAGHVTAQTEGAKKLYTITTDGRAYLEEHRAFVDALLDRLAAIGERAAGMRRRFDEEGSEVRADDALPRSIKGAFQDLSEAVRDLLKREPESKARVIEAIDRAIGDLRKG